VRYRAFLASFPDTQTTTQDLLAEGDKVVERYLAHGTNTGSFMGAPPTGKKFTIESIVTYRIANGKIVEMWGLNDSMSLMQQLDLMPAPG
jgi:predicted ester cyclase